MSNAERFNFYVTESGAAAFNGDVCPITLWLIGPQPGMYETPEMQFNYLGMVK